MLILYWCRLGEARIGRYSHAAVQPSASGAEFADLARVIGGSPNRLLLQEAVRATWTSLLSTATCLQNWPAGLLDATRSLIPCRGAGYAS